MLSSRFGVDGKAVAEGKRYVETHYNKTEYQISMRDGVRLFTSVYTPKDMSGKVPFILFRTPYSCAPYGEDKFPRGFRTVRKFAEERGSSSSCRTYADDSCRRASSST